MSVLDRCRRRLNCSKLFETQSHASFGLVVVVVLRTSTLLRPDFTRIAQIAGAEQLVGSWPRRGSLHPERHRSTARLARPGLSGRQSVLKGDSAYGQWPPPVRAWLPIAWSVGRSPVLTSHNSSRSHGDDWLDRSDLVDTEPNSTRCDLLWICSTTCCVEHAVQQIHNISK